jgi:hypothetical protein
MGIKEYDYAKILYSLYGYDDINNHPFILDSIGNEEIKMSIKKYDYQENDENSHENSYENSHENSHENNCEDSNQDKNKLKLNFIFTEVHKAFMVLIWLSFAEYCKNDISKCIGSYYYGIYLGTLLFFSDTS